MSELIEIQRAFYDNIFGQKHDLTFIASNYANERFNIYRHSILENLINALKITYPGIWSLLGDEYATGVAHLYCHEEQHQPATGCLDDFGESFSLFLGTLPILSDRPYLPDYARYEWQQHLAYIAKDTSPLKPENLASITQDMVDHLCFRFCPSCSLFYSPYPLMQIEAMINGKDTHTDSEEDGPCYGVVSRRDNTVIKCFIDASSWLFIKNLFDGKTLSQSIDEAQEVNDDFDLTTVFAFILDTQIANCFFIQGEDYEKLHDDMFDE